MKKERTESVIREEIHEKVREIYKIRREEEETKKENYISYAGRVYDEKEIIALVDSSLDFWLTAGKYAKEFEKKFSSFIGRKHSLLTNSGSSANLLAISALTSKKLGDRRLKPRDEVITTACGFPTTLNPIIQNGLIPVFVDVELGTYNIRADLLADAVSEKTKAIFVAHTLGNPADIKKIKKTADEHDLWYIEDNCDALGSKYDGRYTGTYGDISTYSFYPAHHITMGEGGTLCTDDDLLNRIILSYRDWGRDCWCPPGKDNTCGKRFTQKFGKLPYGYDHKYVYSHIGYNLKVTDMQAAVGVEQLIKLPSFIEKRKENYRSLYKGLEKYEKYFLLPKATPGSDPSWFGFPILVKEGAGFKREDIVKFLEENRIATRMLFGGNLLKQPAYEDIEYRCIDTLENTDLVMENLFWVGVYPGISREKTEYILSVFDRFIEKKD
ncbi:MAG: lipopolysaccharide biosynthesis protein RfbH [Candidatus Altiarchaeia archaeon]